MKRNLPAQDTWILNAEILTQDQNRRALNGNIWIKNGRIEAIRPRAPSKFSKGTHVIDAKGLTLLPGFIQAHVHLCQTLFRNQADDLELLDWLSKRIWPMEAAHTEETLYASALLGIHELLSSGTTCILDMGTVRHTDSIFHAIEETGIRASVGKCLMDHPTTTPESLRDKTRDALVEAQDLYQRWHGKASDRIRVSYAPRFVISCTEQLLTEVAKISREQNAIIHTHASENLKEIQLIKKLVNCENVEYLDQIGMASSRLVLAHCIWLKPHEMNLLEKSRVNVVHCPSSNMKLASGFARIPEMLNRGINVALGADGAPCNNNLNMFQEMRLAALIHKPSAGPQAVRAQEVLDMATLNGARALGWSNEIGSIEVGKKADLIALDLNRPENSRFRSATNKPSSEALASAIVYSGQPSHVKWTMVDGKKVYQNGRVTHCSTQKLMELVGQAQEKIQKSMKRLPLS